MKEKMIQSLEYLLTKFLLLKYLRIHFMMTHWKELDKFPIIYFYRISLFLCNMYLL